MGACTVQVGDLGRSSIGGKGVRIDVKRGLRFQSPETVCSGTTTKVNSTLATALTNMLAQQPSVGAGLFVEDTACLAYSALVMW